MYSGGITFLINKSFGHLQLVPEPNGLRMYYVPVIDGIEVKDSLGFLDLVIPLDAIGGLWATTRAFLRGVESLDENIILKGTGESEESDILIKLYRDKPRGQHGKLAGDETPWLRIVTGRSEEERRRVKLGPRDLMCLELACSSVFQLAGITGYHNPKI